MYIPHSLYCFKKSLTLWFIVIRPSAEGSPASTPGASDMLQRMQAYRGHPAQQA